MTESDTTFVPSVSAGEPSLLGRARSFGLPRARNVMESSHLETDGSESSDVNVG
jgi:hypothetical protein